jgi:hypothetical protein
MAVPASLTIPTRATGTADPANDMNAVVTNQNAIISYLNSNPIVAQSRQLPFQYLPGTSNDAYELVLPAVAGSYGTQAIGNVATVAYYVNGNSVAVTLPITLGAGDSLRASITRTTTAAGAYVVLSA